MFYTIEERVVYSLLWVLEWRQSGLSL